MLGSNLRAILFTDTLQKGRLVSLPFLLQASFNGSENPMFVFPANANK
jgi:hypothetical protein